jgi:hypothetical protein
MFDTPMVLKIMIMLVTSRATWESADEVSGKPSRSNTVLLEIPLQLLTRTQIDVAHVAILARLLIPISPDPHNLLPADRRHDRQACRLAASLAVFDPFDLRNLRWRSQTS